MLTIPSGDAAREAWDALAPKVRDDVIRLADQDRGHPDAAVAAIAVGRARAEVWPWWRTTMFGVGMCLFAGAGLAFVMISPSVFDPSVREWTAVAVPGLAGLLLFDSAPRLRTGARLPRATEIENLRVFLASPDARPSPPAEPRSALTPRRIATAVAVAAGIVTVALGALRLSGAPVGFLGTPPDGAGILIGLAVLLAFVAYQIRRQPIRVRAQADGLRFNWRRRRIPWSEVISVAVGAKGVVWLLRDGSSVETPLIAHGRLPEELILAARSYMDAARQSA